MSWILKGGNMNGKYAGKKMYTAMSAFFLIYLSFVLPFKMFITGYLLQTKYFFGDYQLLKRYVFAEDHRPRCQLWIQTLKGQHCPLDIRFQKSGHPTCAPMRQVQYTHRQMMVICWGTVRQNVGTSDLALPFCLWREGQIGTQCPICVRPAKTKIAGDWLLWQTSTSSACPDTTRPKWLSLLPTIWGEQYTGTAFKQAITTFSTTAIIFRCGIPPAGFPRERKDAQTHPNNVIYIETCPQ